VFYSLFGRLLLSFILPPESPNYIFRFFCRLTNWVVYPVAFVTPRFIPPLFLPPIAAFWIALARVLLRLWMQNQGWIPRLPFPPGCTF
jgi:YggT family protein